MSRRTETPFWDPNKLMAGLSTRRLGRPLHLFNRISSTNEFAKRIARRGAPSGTLVLADAQTSGRGRHGRRWESPPDRGLWLSFIVRPPASARQLGLLPLLVGAVIVEILEQSFGAVFSVKWPNDVLCEGRKICGILCEAQFSPHAEFVIVGIGLNVNQSAYEFPPGLRNHAHSLAMLTGRPVDRQHLLIQLLQGLDRAFFSSAGLPVDLLARWKRACADLGATVTLHRGGEQLTGVFESVSGDGELVLKCGNTTHLLTAADFSLEKRIVTPGGGHEKPALRGEGATPA